MSDSQLNRAATLAREGRYQEAASALEHSLGAHPSAEAYDVMGVCLMKQGDLRAAVKNHLAAIEMAPPLPSAFVNLFNTVMLMHVSDDAQRVAEAGVAVLPPASPEAAELHIGMAKLAWLEGRMVDVFNALRASMAIRTEFADYPNVGELRAAHRYLERLLSLRQSYEGSAYEGTPEKALFFVADTHGFGPSETVVYLDGEFRRVLSVLISGCSAAHIACGVDNEYRASVAAIVRAIPAGHPIAFGFGAIDCELGSGRSSHDGVAATGSMSQRVDDYVGFVHAAAAAYGHTVLLYGVPAPNPRLAAELSEERRHQLVAVVRTFNDALRHACRARTLRLLDVHAYTATVEGVADERHHVDLVHVHPDTLTGLCDRPRAQRLRR